VEARVAFQLQAADDIQDIDQADLAEGIHQHPALGIKFPFIVGLGSIGGVGRGQIAMARIAPRQLGMVEQRGNPRAAGKRMVLPGRVRTQFGQDGGWPPPGCARRRVRMASRSGCGMVRKGALAGRPRGGVNPA